MAKYLIILLIFLVQCGFVKAEDVDHKAEINLNITQTDTPDPIKPDNELSYTLTIKNIGTNSVAFVQVEDTLPAGVEFISATGTDWKCSENNAQIICDFQKGFLKAGDTTPDIVIKVKVPSDAKNTLINTASLSSTGKETDSSDNTSTEETEIAIDKEINLKITQTDTPDPVKPDNELTYTLNIENIGKEDASLIQVEDTLPKDVEFISATGSNCSEKDNKVVCDFQSLKAGETAQEIIIKVKVSSNANKTLTNTVTVTASEKETDDSDNTSTEETNISTETEVNLKITQIDTPDPVKPDEELTYTLSIENIGKENASLIQVEDTLPNNVEFISATGSNCSEKDNKVVCDFQSLKAGETAPEIIIKVKVSSNANNTLTNTVTVTADGKETDDSDNTATEETKIEIISFKLKTDVSPDKSGTIEPDQTTFTADEQVNIIATPSECYEFSHWEGACQDSQVTECNLTMNSDKETIAHFKTKTVKLNTTAENGQIDIQPPQAEYSCDDKVTLTPIPDENYQFLVWSGDISGKQNPLNLVLKQPEIDITAIFEKFSDLEIKPVNVHAVAKQNIKFTASGGSGYFFWTATSGNIQPSDDGKTAIYTVPEEAGSFYVWLSDGSSFAWALVNNDLAEKPIIFIRIIPNNLTLSKGDQQTITVRGYQTDGNSKNLITDVDFSIENPDIIEINSNNNQIFAKATGTSKVIAKYQDITAESTIEVVHDDPILQVKPNILSLEEGSSKTINIFLVNQSGVKTIINNATLIIDDSNIASIEKYTITGTNKGVASLKITVKDKSLSIPIIVRSNPKLEITPHRASIVVNETTIFKVTGGKPPYQIQTNTGSLQQQSKNSYIFTSKVSGTAVLNVIDNAQNKAQATINIVSPLSVTPEKVVLTSNEAVSLRANGGDGNYTWIMSQGKLNTQNGDTVNYNAPAKTGLYVVTVIDGLGNNKEVLVSVGEKLLLSQQQLFLKPEEKTKLRVVGGIPPYTLNISTGTANLQQNGIINYTAPKQAGAHTLSVIDAQDNQVTTEITVALDLLITPKSGRLDAREKLTLHAIGGFGKKRWVVSKGKLDKTEGETVIWTTPNNFGPAFIHVIDSKGHKATASLEVSSSGFAITPSIRHVYPEDSTNFTSIGGAAPYKWTVESGDYVKLKDDSITYTAPKVRGSYQITVQDNSGKTAQAQINVYSTRLFASPKTLYINCNDEPLPISIGGGTGSYTITANLGKIADNQLKLEEKNIVMTTYKAPLNYEGYDTINILDSAGNLANIEVEITKNSDIISFYAGQDGIINQQEMQQAIDDFFDGQVCLDRITLFQIIEKFLSTER
jgi:uncharacterized repeat protein (TIGR01451 family)